jgi:hypothetical protein
MDLGTVTIPARFQGPPNSANGGYASGLAASFIDGTAEVTLRSPPPLDTPLRVVRGNGAVTLHDGEVLVMEARAATLELELPRPVPFDDAERASADWPGHESHYFPECFVCGTKPSRDEGLRLHPWWVDDERIAAPWVPRGWMCDEGVVRREIVWAALDCPSAWTWRGDADAMIVLGRLTAELLAPIRDGEPISVVSWPLGGEGRKYEAATALFDQNGIARAASRAVWITLRT